MASSKKPGPETGSLFVQPLPARTPGFLGYLDQSDPNVAACFGNTPGPLGINDYGQLTIFQSSAVGSILQPASSGMILVPHSTPESVSKPTSAATSPEALLPTPDPAAPLLSEEDFRKAAEELGVEAAAVHAVAEVEGGSRTGFDKKGRPKILFEARWFSKFTLGKYDKKYPHLSQQTWAGAKKYYSLDQWGRMYEAMTLNQEAAWKSASWGKFQVMGFNHNGWDNVKDFVFAMFKSEAQHLQAFLAYCKDRNLVRHLKNKDWAAFAYGYNGELYAQNNYHTKMKAAYEKYSKLQKPK